MIQEELPEDSSDEEYNPEHDKQSDDDREIESTTNSDIESQPSTPADILDIASTEQHASLHVQYDPEGIFKIPMYVRKIFFISIMLFDHNKSLMQLNISNVFQFCNIVILNNG